MTRKATEAFSRIDFFNVPACDQSPAVGRCTSTSGSISASQQRAAHLPDLVHSTRAPQVRQRKRVPRQSPSDGVGAADRLAAPCARGCMTSPPQVSAVALGRATRSSMPQLAHAYQRPISTARPDRAAGSPLDPAVDRFKEI
jgi:hypothetical protein